MQVFWHFPLTCPFFNMFYYFGRYTSKMLLAAIDEQCRGTYDFLYLPIDFKASIYLEFVDSFLV